MSRRTRLALAPLLLWPLLPALMPAQALAADDAEMAAACRTLQGSADCDCFARMAREEMTVLQREVLLIQLTGRDLEAASTMGEDAGRRYQAALERLTARIQAECR